MNTKARNRKLCPADDMSLQITTVPFLRWPVEGSVSAKKHTLTI